MRVPANPGVGASFRKIKAERQLPFEPRPLQEGADRLIVKFEQGPSQEDGQDEYAHGDSHMLPERSLPVFRHPVYLHIDQRKMRDVNRI